MAMLKLNSIHYIPSIHLIILLYQVKHSYLLFQNLPKFSHQPKSNFLIRSSSSKASNKTFWFFDSYSNEVQSIKSVFWIFEFHTPWRLAWIISMISFGISQSISSKKPNQNLPIKQFNLHKNLLLPASEQMSENNQINTYYSDQMIWRNHKTNSSKQNSQNKVLIICQKTHKDREFIAKTLKYHIFGNNFTNVMRNAL
jgi:hypothetical protein